MSGFLETLTAKLGLASQSYSKQLTRRWRGSEMTEKDAKRLREVERELDDLKNVFTGKRNLLQHEIDRLVRLK